MSDLEQARQLFTDAGLAFPTIPDKLAIKLKKRSKWLFSTRTLKISPYNLAHYVDEPEGSHRTEYAVLCHSGHGVNSYAIQYYLVCGPLHMFLHLGWGGVYRDANQAASEIRECFLLADKIMPAAVTSESLAAGERLRLVGSDFYGSYWSTPRQGRQGDRSHFQRPAEVLADILHWLKDTPPNNRMQPTMPKAHRD